MVPFWQVHLIDFAQGTAAAAVEKSRWRKVRFSPSLLFGERKLGGFLDWIQELL